MLGCAHTKTKRGKDAPLRYGSYRTEVCKTCGAYRTHGHDMHRSNMSKWQPASAYENATSDNDED